MFSIATALVVAFGAVSTVSAADCSRSYTVKVGDWCDSISAANQVSSYQLQTLNQPAINAGCTNLQPEQVLCLSTVPEDSCNTVYTVKPDDTCNSIIESHAGVNSTVLHLNNPQINEGCSNIYVGEVLCVGSSVQVPPGAGAVIEPPTNVAGSPPPVPTPAHTEPAAAAAPPPPAPTHQADNGADAEDDDDEDLPYCDEIDD